MVEMEKRFAARLQEIDALAKNQPLIFQAQARLAYASYTRQMRREAKRLRARGATEFEFYRAWQDEYLPRMRKIDESIGDGKLDRMLTRVLLATDASDVARMTSCLRELCQARERQAIVTMFDVKRQKRARKTLRKVLIRSDEQVSRQVEAGLTHELYRTIASRRGLLVDDAQLRLMHRMVKRGRVRRQAKRIIRRTQRQIAQIDREIYATEQLHDGLVARLFSLKIDLVEVLAARQDYEKALGRLSETSRKSPTKKLDVYEKKTAKIRTTYLDSLPELGGLKEVQQAAKEIDDTLLKVFDLGAQESNDLMRALKRYRDLVRERDVLTSKIARA